MLRGSDHVAGIDLGTTNSCISIFKNQHVEVAVDALGNRTTPSMVAFNDMGRLYGRSAKMQVVHNCKNTVYDAKRLIGHLYNEKGVQEDIKHWPFTVKANEKGRPIIEVTCKKEKMEYTPEQISGFVIENLISIANSFSNGSITDVVITVPAYFNNSQRQATIDAGTLAGCNVLEVLNEPTAAAIAYGFENTGNKTILVYDLGGGTFDCTILRVEDSVYTVIGTDGDSHLGGDDFDAIMMNLIQQKLEMMECTVDFTTDRNKQKLRNVAEHAKIELSSLTEVDISEDSWECEPFVITRKEFEQSCMDLFNRTQSILKRLMTSTQVLERLNASAEEMTEKIDDVVLIGGSSRIPYVKNMLIAMFGEEKVFEKINPDEAVSKGAVIEAVRLKDLQEKAKESESANDEGGFDIDTDDDDDDDDESRYAPLAIKKLTVKQVIPLPIGVKRSDGMMSVILDKNTPYGEKHTKEYVTSKDNMQSMKLHILQGERPVARDNFEIGVLRITGIPPKPKGEASVEITMEVDDNGILKMSVMETTTHVVTEHVFDNNATNLTEAEIREMRETAERLREEDKKKVELMMIMNEIQEMVQKVKQGVEANQEQMDDDFKESFNQFLGEIRELKKKRMEVTKEELEETKSVCQQWIDAVYGEAQ